jgi:exopolysaccharide biosynthesis protein
MRVLLALLGLVAGLLAERADASPAAGASRAAVEARWRPAAPGLEMSLRPVAGALLLLVRADPAMTRLRVVLSERGKPITAATLAQRDGALATINGGFFDGKGQPIGWLVSGGLVHAPPSSRGWAAFTVSGDRARIVNMKDARGPVDEAIQAGPRLVTAGRANPALKAQVARRAFIGLDAQGRVVLGTTVPTQMSATDLATFLATPESAGGAGLIDALALDGGSSAQIFTRDASGQPIDLAGIPVPVLLESLPRER